MIAVILDLLRAARGRTAVLLLLGTLPVAAAVAGPAYIAAAERTIVAHEVAGAQPGETVLSFQRPGEDPGSSSEVFERLGGGAINTPGFEPIFGASFDVALPTAEIAFKLSYRDDLCAHVTLDAGRCPNGRGEVMLGFRTAERIHAVVGATLPFRQSTFVARDGANELVRVGAAVPLSVVGIYRPNDPAAAYWGASPPFPPGLLTNPSVGSDVANNVGVEPVFGSRGTAKLFSLEVPEAQAYDLVADPAQLTTDWVDRYPAEIQRLTGKAVDNNATLVTGADPLIARIGQSRAAVRSLVPWLALTVVPLCWFVIFLASASGSDTRRTDLGQVALRGMPAPHRWWLAAGPDWVALLAGAPFGFVAGQFLGGRAVPDGGFDLAAGGNTLRYALVAVVGALLAAALAYRPLVRGRAIDLLRKVTRQGGAWRSATIDAMVVALAVFTVIEARNEAGPVRGGLGILAPALLILTGALLAGRLLGPAARRVGNRALLAGRLSGALAGIELSRRSAPRRAVTLAVLGAALLCFAVLAVDLGGAAREQRAGIELGADRVFNVNPMAGGALRTAVRQADPEGRWAMAVVRIPATGSGPTTIAADTDRLAAVAWPGAVPADLSARLRPPRAPSLSVSGSHLRLDVTGDFDGIDVARLQFFPGDSPELKALVQAPGEADRSVSLGLLRPGRQHYDGSLPQCQPACRLIGLEADPIWSTTVLTVHEISTTGPDKVVAGPDVLRDATRWRATTEDGIEATAPEMTSAADGLTVKLLTTQVPQRVLVADAPPVLPILRTTTAVAQETDTGWALSSPGHTETVPADSVGTLATLPGLGAKGLLVDLDYLDTAAPMGAGGTPQVWIGPDAPADAIARLADVGLTVLGETSMDDVADLAALDGAALASRYELVSAGFAVLLVLLGLGLVAAAENTERTARTRVLRSQGVAARTLRSAARHLRLWPTLLGVLLGPPLAVAAWVVANPAIPVFLDTDWPLALPTLPDPVTLGLVWAACAVPLLVLALFRQRRSATL
jgi:putative ABC transport system permease protein